MTRLQVIESDQVIMSSDDDTNLAKEEAKKILRWDAKIGFKEGAKAVVQYFVAKVDEESRKKPVKKTEKYSAPKREEVNSLYEVVTEEENDQLPITNYELKNKEEEKEIEIEEKKPADAKSFGEAKEEFSWESLLNKSPLPDRAIMSPEGDTSPVKIEKKETEKEIIKTENVKKKFNLNLKNKNYFKWIIGGILGILLIFLLVNVIKLVQIPGQIKASESLIETGKYDEAAKKIDYLRKNNQYWLGMFGNGKVASLLKIEEGAIEILDLGRQIAERGEKMADGFWGNKEVSMTDELQKINSDLEALISDLGILQGRLSSGWQWLPGRFREKIGGYEEIIKEKRQIVEELDKLMPILPEFLGLDGKKREYMVLFQNENELRASGGFIGSYGILSVEDGKWRGLEVNDVYQADGQLKGHVEPSWLVYERC